MNLLGKLLIVLIFIGSIVLASWSVALFSTHTNWREQYNKRDQELQAKTKDFADLQRQRDNMEAALKLEVQNQISRNQALSETVRQLTQENADLVVENTELRNNLAIQVAAVEAAHETMERLRIRFDGLSKALSDAQNEWVAMSTELVKKMDEAHGLAVQVTNYRETAAKLAEDYRKAMEVLRLHGLSDDPALFPKRPPSGIQGVVTEVRPNGWVELSIGLDSGLAKGHQLDVVRNRDGRSVYVGKVEIAAPAADRATARVMPEFRLGVVRVGDEVMYIEVGGQLAAH